MKKEKDNHSPRLNNCDKGERKIATMLVKRLAYPRLAVYIYCILVE